MTDNTKQLIDGHINDDSYYKTIAVEQAMEIFREYSILVVVGHEGSGKSTLCLEIAKRHEIDDFTALIFSPSDLKNLNNCIVSNKSQICILDINIQADSIDSTIKDVLKKCITYSNNTNHKFIFTVLTTYQTTEFYLERFEKNQHLNLVNSLSQNDKIGILELHMVKNKVRKCDNAYESNYEDPEVIDDSTKTVKIYKKILQTIVETDTFVGFPTACQKFFSNRSLLHLEHRYFNTPSESIIRDINLYRYKPSLFENRKYIVLVYIMMENQLDLSDIRKETMEMLLRKLQISPDKMQKHHVKDSANDLVTTVLNCSHEIYTFHHPTLSKAVWMSYIDVDTDYCVLYCDWDFVDDYIRPKSWPLHETDVCLRIDMSNIISRLQHEIRYGSAWSVCQYLMKFIKFGKEVIESFFQQYSEGKYTIDSSLYLCNAFSKFGSTFEMFEHFPAAKEMLLLSGIDQYENCLLHYCVLQDYTGMLINLPNSFIDTYMSVLNINKYSPFHLEVYLGRQEMFKKHMPHVDRTYENYTKLNRLYYKGERHFGKPIEEKHLNFIGKMNLHSDVLQSSHFGSKKDFFSIRDMLMTFKKASMLMVRIKNLPPTVADTEIEKVLESFTCKIIKQYRERHRRKGRITNVETGDRIVICKPFSILLPDQIRILQYDVKVSHDGQPSENNVKADCSQPDGKTS